MAGYSNFGFRVASQYASPRPWSGGGAGDASGGSVNEALMELPPISLLRGAMAIPEAKRSGAGALDAFRSPRTFEMMKQDRQLRERYKQSLDTTMEVINSGDKYAASEAYANAALMMAADVGFDMEKVQRILQPLTLQYNEKYRQAQAQQLEGGEPGFENRMGAADVLMGADPSKTVQAYARGREFGTAADLNVARGQTEGARQNLLNVQAAAGGWNPNAGGSWNNPLSVARYEDAVTDRKVRRHQALLSAVEKLNNPQDMKALRESTLLSSDPNSPPEMVDEQLANLEHPNAEIVQRRVDVWNQANPQESYDLRHEGGRYFLEPRDVGTGDPEYDRLMGQYGPDIPEQGMSIPGMPNNEAFALPGPGSGPSQASPAPQPTPAARPSVSPANAPVPSLPGPQQVPGPGGRGELPTGFRPPQRGAGGGWKEEARPEPSSDADKLPPLPQVFWNRGLQGNLRKSEVHEYFLSRMDPRDAAYVANVYWQRIVEASGQPVQVQR